MFKMPKPNKPSIGKTSKLLPNRGALNQLAGLPSRSLLDYSKEVPTQNPTSGPLLVDYMRKEPS
jgi:hypothetical protein